MALIPDRTDTLFKEKIDILRNDLGRTVTVYSRATGTACSWCYLDSRTNKSSGVSKPGMVWSTHSNSDGINLVCPECSGLYYLNATTTTTISGVIIEDISGQKFESGKAYFFKAGTKKLIGKLSDILSDSTDADSKSILETAVKILIDGEDHRIVSSNKLGLKTRYLFEAIVEKVDLSEN